MNDTNLESGDGIELNLRSLVDVAAKYWRILLAAAVLGAGAAVAAAYFFLPPQYQSSVMFYVNNGGVAAGETSASISSGDLSTARNLVDSYIVILKIRESLLEVIRYAGVDIPYLELEDMISASAVNNTEFFRVVVTGPDPYEAEKIANAIGQILPGRISAIIEGTTAKMVDPAMVAWKPCTPGYGIYALLGFAAGALLGLGALLLRELADGTIRNGDDVSQACACPVLAVVPDMREKTRGRFFFQKAEGKPPVVGSALCGTAAESYKLLRTKLQFSFADEGNCRVIGISSTQAKEGKSLSAVNLAYALSQLNKKVLLIDADMRRSSLQEKLPVSKAPGLSDYLAGQDETGAHPRPCGLPGEESAFFVIGSGQNPPNPMELLSSARMEAFLRDQRERFEYILLDLPPVGEVGDALAAAKALDGFLLVVRQNVCSRTALKEVVRQLEFVNTRVLGVVINAAAELGKQRNAK